MYVHNTQLLLGNQFTKVWSDWKVPLPEQELNGPSKGIPGPVQKCTKRGLVQYLLNWKTHFYWCLLVSCMQYWIEHDDHFYTTFNSLDNNIRADSFFLSLHLGNSNFFCLFFPNRILKFERRRRLNHWIHLPFKTLPTRSKNINASGRSASWRSLLVFEHGWSESRRSCHVTAQWPIPVVHLEANLFYYYHVIEQQTLDCS